MFFTDEMAHGLPTLEFLPVNLFGIFDGTYSIPSSKTIIVVKNEQLHNETGPAFISLRRIEWWLEGQYHKLNGPAVILKIHNKPSFNEFWIHDVRYNEQEYWQHPLVVENKLNKILEL